MDSTRPATDWDRYWRGTWEAAAHEDGSPQDAALEAFWREFFAELPGDRGESRLLDIASGNGAVIRYAADLAAPNLERYALDYSPSALYNLRQRYPGVHCVAADARRPALVAASFEAVVSQYGIEYAGIEAVIDAAQLVASGGHLALVLHYRDGAIYRECDANRRVLREIKALDVLDLARAAFGAGFALNSGRGTVDEFKAAERNFVPAVRGLEKLLQQEGRQVAGGLLQQIYTDIATMYRRMSAYAEADVMQWLDGLGPELDAYIGRMQSMLDAAVDERQLDTCCRELREMGFEVLQRDRLRIGADSRPAAWTLVARRDAA